MLLNMQGLQAHLLLVFSRTSAFGPVASCDSVPQKHENHPRLDARYIWNDLWNSRLFSTLAALNFTTSKVNILLEFIWGKPVWVNFFSDVRSTLIFCNALTNFHPREFQVLARLGVLRLLRFRSFANA